MDREIEWTHEGKTYTSLITAEIYRDFDEFFNMDREKTEKYIIEMLIKERFNG